MGIHEIRAIAFILLIVFIGIMAVQDWRRRK